MRLNSAILTGGDADPATMRRIMRASRAGGRRRTPVDSDHLGRLNHNSATTRTTPTNRRENEQGPHVIGIGRQQDEEEEQQQSVAVLLVIVCVRVASLAC